MSIDIVEQLEFASEQSCKGARIVIIDGDDASVDILECRLSEQGFRTLCAVTGRAGLEVVLGEQPDLVLVDSHLPDASGLDICSQLADNAKTCLIPVIVLGEDHQPEFVRKARAAGARFFLRKPYDPNVLLLLIQESLKQPAEEW